jgi:crossover junction endodeoxyribonuclease RusA
MTRPYLVIDLPTTPPSVNHYWQTSGKMRFISESGKAFQSELIPVARMAAAQLGWRPTKAMRLGLRIHVQFPDRRKRDLDNILKSAIDALAVALDFDDSQIDSLHVGRLPVAPKTGRTRLYLWSLDDDDRSSTHDHSDVR